MPRWENGFQTNEEIQAYKRYAVIREAARIISRQGFHNTSLDAVAKVLGISKGTLYNYVKDKQEILFECHKISLDLGEYAAQFASEAGGLSIDRLRLLLRCFIIWMYGQAGVGGLTFDVNALRAEDRAVVVARRDAMEATLVGLLKEGVEDGSLRAGDPKITVYAIMSAINGISSWYSPDGRVSIEDIADQMLDLLTHSLATRPEKLAPYPPVPAYPMQAAPLGLLSRGTVATNRVEKPAPLGKKALPPRKTVALPSKRKARNAGADA
ncbi:TetR/AcrR family transcriptional regulator [Rhizorhabdus dicambivorans]|uniref:TetR/AcrR family transcriptional regulator n=1 Tax=Rhizorhabdus dicambivorans TaxID=1850238 RepID=A0A2A4FVA4_9SPHN|nr:TetR/AcrR family transcriptional regulator [Rhizorhabdus dicambivorans]ATE64736.1 TetR/AcrR family transcriptional regulator [Rhizorhabdus dicambivorans]PCE41321.1 TetR/AcrR family transcriptional regulator [Rhizorhabdus dicambivorans]